MSRSDRPAGRADGSAGTHTGDGAGVRRGASSRPAACSTF